MEEQLRAWALTARREPALLAVRDFLRGTPAWVVGGAVRDALLGREVVDYDLALDGDALEIARGLARKLRWAIVPLDEERRIARVVPRQGNLYFDLARLAGPTIEEDLRRRDLTVNALGVSLDDLLEVDTPVLLDPTGGLADFERRSIRVPGPWSLADDPLRVLRVYRFACHLGYDVDPGTAALVPSHIEALGRVSVERVRDEVFKVLCQAGPAPYVAMMPLAAALRGFVLDPAGLQTLARVTPSTPLQPWLAVSDTEGRDRLSLVKLAALVQTRTRDAAEAYRLSAKEARALEAMGRTLAEAEAVVASPDIERCMDLFDAAEDASAACLLLAAARTGRTESLDTLAGWLSAWEAPPLLKGGDVIRVAGLKPGPEVGRLSRLLRRAQTRGDVTTVTDAEVWVRAKGQG